MLVLPGKCNAVCGGLFGTPRRAHRRSRWRRWSSAREERWQALSARDYARVWEFGTPNYRSVFPKELYVLQFSYAVDRQLTGVEVVDYDAAAAVASVTARVMSKPLKQTSTASQALGALPVTVREKWMFIDGNGGSVQTFR